MRLRNYLLAFAGICVTGSISAQINFTTRQFFPNGVNNEGVVVGHKDQRTSQELWYPSTNQFEAIGGISAGSGIGGVARFSADGRKISSTVENNNVPLSTELKSVVSHNFSDFTFGCVRFTSRTGRAAFAVGSSADRKKGIILNSTNKGQIWRDVKGEIDGGDFTGGLVSMAALTYARILVGGHNGAIYYTRNEGVTWQKYTVRPINQAKTVDTYWTIDFIPGEGYDSALRGAIGLEYTDGSYAVWQTEDGGDNLTEATGVNGVPTHIGHFADNFYLTTRNGYVQKSTDTGKTWTDIFTTENNVALNSIAFLNENVGIAVGEGVVYVTTDGGVKWDKKEVAAGVTWNDVAWNGETATIVGTGNSVYETKDKGQTWTKLNILAENEDANLCSIAIDEHATSVSGETGSMFWKSNYATISATAAGVYDLKTKQWTPMASLGFVGDETVSDAYNISANGEWIVGSVKSYKYENEYSTIHGHAAIWDKDGNVIDLGSKFSAQNKMSRASAVSFDGSVVVGCQDIWGPWYASVWRRNTDGTYTQKLMLKDPDKTEEDIDYEEPTKQDMARNLLAMCQTVTADGKWIGGRGEPTNTAVGSPWIWSEESGLVLLDPSENAAPGTVAAMNSDASVIVGWHYSGESSPWIWTKEDGMMDLNDYVSNTLGADLKGHYLCSVYDMSPNGRYITGWCMKGQGKFGYIVDLMSNPDGIESVALDQCRATVYPNPVSDELHIDFPFDDVNTNIRLLSQQGMVVKQTNTSVISNTMDLNDVPAGLYILDVEVEGVHKAFKIEVVH